jgi:hypothetical protein
MAKNASDELMDLIYTGVGFALFSFQKAMVARNDIEKEARRLLGLLSNKQ